MSQVDIIDPGPYIQWGGLAITVLVFAAAFLVPRLRRRPEPAPEPERDDTPRCTYCDRPAQRPPSHTARGMGMLDEVRVRLGSAPRYAPAVDHALAPSLCHTCGRTWDTFLAEELAAVIATERKAAESRIAIRMGSAERTGLHERMLREALTDEQRKAYERRRPRER